MPSYEALILLRPGVKEAATKTLQSVSQIILGRGGVVRKMEHMGEDILPHRTRVHKEYFYTSWPWTVRFDAAPDTVNELRATLADNTDVIRTTFVKQDPVYKPKTTKFHRCKNLSTGTVDDLETRFVNTRPGSGNSSFNR